MKAAFKEPPVSQAGYVLDASVMSALALGRDVDQPTPFQAWLLSHSDQLFIPCTTVAELTQCIEAMRRAGDAERADRLDRWLDRLVAGYNERILPLDAAVMRRAGRLCDAATARGVSAAFPEVAIAALALLSSRVLLTRNPKAFQVHEVPSFDPIE